MTIAVSRGDHLVAAVQDSELAAALIAHLDGHSGRGGPWAELAESILSGATLRDVATSTVYRHLLEAAWAGYDEWDASLTSDERQDMLCATREVMYREGDHR